MNEQHVTITVDDQATGALTDVAQSLQKQALATLEHQYARGWWSDREYQERKAQLNGTSTHEGDAAQA